MKIKDSSHIKKQPVVTTGAKRTHLTVSQYIGSQIDQWFLRRPGFEPWSRLDSSPPVT